MKKISRGENNMQRFKIIALLTNSTGITRSPIAFHVELPTLDDAIKHADIMGLDTDPHPRIIEVLSIWTVSPEPPEIKGMIEWVTAAKRNKYTDTWHRTHTNTNTIKEA